MMTKNKEICVAELVSGFFHVVPDPQFYEVDHCALSSRSAVMLTPINAHSKWVSTASGSSFLHQRTSVCICASGLSIPIKICTLLCAEILSEIRTSGMRFCALHWIESLFTISGPIDIQCLSRGWVVGHNLYSDTHLDCLVISEFIVCIVKECFSPFSARSLANDS